MAAGVKSFRVFGEDDVFWLRARIRPETFNRFLLILLFIIGLNLVRRGLL